jgi:hypothetical protein
MQLKVTGKARLLDALAEWGRHEALGRLKPHLGEIPPSRFDGESGALQAVDIVLRFRAPVLARILGSLPVGCLRVELAKEDIPALRVFDGRSAADYANELMRESAYVRGLAAGHARIEGPLLASARGADRRVVAPLTIFEGCHRLAAWIGQLAGGRAAYPLSSYLVVTQYETELFPK